MLKRSVFAAICFVTAGAAVAQTGPAAPRATSAAPATRVAGALTLQGVPPIPQALLESQRRYQNARSAALQGWLPDGSILISTRFGNTAQIHRVAGPGAARTQLTFFDEPVVSAEPQPGAQRFVYTRDQGGAEYYQA